MSKDNHGSLGNAINLAVGGKVSLVEQLTGELLVNDARVIGLETGIDSSGLNRLGGLPRLKTLITIQIVH